MTRAEYIDAVKVKLEEISPFDEPASFIAAEDSEKDAIKPIVSYIDRSLDEAVQNCLRTLPMSLLHTDVEFIGSVGGSAGVISMSIDESGVGRFTPPQSVRLVRFRHAALKRDITAFITSEDPLYLLQQNPYTRGGIAKPVAVWSSDEQDMEIYSFPKELWNTTDTTGKLLGVRTNKTAGSDVANHVLSPIEDFVVLECAAMVSDILGDTAAAQSLRSQEQEKLLSILS